MKVMTVPPCLRHLNFYVSLLPNLKKMKQIVSFWLFRIPQKYSPTKNFKEPKENTTKQKYKIVKWLNYSLAKTNRQMSVCSAPLVCTEGSLWRRHDGVMTNHRAATVKCDEGVLGIHAHSTLSKKRIRSEERIAIKHEDDMTRQPSQAPQPSHSV